MFGNCSRRTVSGQERAFWLAVPNGRYAGLKQSKAKHEIGILSQEFPSWTDTRLSISWNRCHDKEKVNAHRICNAVRFSVFRP